MALIRTFRRSPGICALAAMIALVAATWTTPELTAPAEATAGA